MKRKNTPLEQLAQNRSQGQSVRKDHNRITIVFVILVVEMVGVVRGQHRVDPPRFDPIQDIRTGFTRGKAVPKTADPLLFLPIARKGLALKIPELLLPQAGAQFVGCHAVVKEGAGVLGRLPRPHEWTHVEVDISNDSSLRWTTLWNIVIGLTYFHPLVVRALLVIVVFIVGTENLFDPFSGNPGLFLAFFGELNIVVRLLPPHRRVEITLALAVANQDHQ